LARRPDFIPAGRWREYADKLAFPPPRHRGYDRGMATLFIFWSIMKIIGPWLALFCVAWYACGTGYRASRK
jgi:hypothetical protein